MSDNKTSSFPGGILRAAFGRAARAVEYYTTHYPSKCAAGAGLIGDFTFGVHAYLSGNYVGAFGAFVGAIGSITLMYYGDPKISEAEKEAYVDPQTKRKGLRNFYHCLESPAKYPWEYVSCIRIFYMGYMTLGSVGIGAQEATLSPGELSNALFALAGYFTKLSIAEEPQGSVRIPENSRSLGRMYYKSKAYLLENPNTVAGAMWNVGLVPYFVEGVVEGVTQGNWLKAGSAAFYALPNTFTMFSSKRAQVAPTPVV